MYLFLIVDLLICAFVFSLMWGGHWFRWAMVPALMNKYGQLRRIYAYIFGVSGILTGLVLWTAVRALAGVASVEVWQPLVFICCDVFSAFLGTILPRSFRTSAELAAAQEDALDYERHLQGRTG